MTARAGAGGLVAAGVLLAVATADAQVITDGSLGPATALSGPVFFINPSLGQMRGGNFRTFSIDSSQQAFFTGTGLTNIFALALPGTRLR